MHGILFQYQQKAQPINAPPAEPDRVPVWLPHFPDRLYPPRALHPAHYGYYASGIAFAGVRESQEPVELVFIYGDPYVRESQEPVEIIEQPDLTIREARASQVPVEIIYPFGCYTYQPPPPPGCVVEFPIDQAPADAGCPAPTFNDVG